MGWGGRGRGGIFGRGMCQDEGKGSSSMYILTYRVMNKGRIKRSKGTLPSIAVAVLPLKMAVFMPHSLSVQINSVSISPGSIDTIH